MSLNFKKFTKISFMKKIEAEGKWHSHCQFHWFLTTMIRKINWRQNDLFTRLSGESMKRLGMQGLWWSDIVKLSMGDGALIKKSVIGCYWNPSYTAVCTDHTVGTGPSAAVTALINSSLGTVAAYGIIHLSRCLFYRYGSNLEMELWRCILASLKHEHCVAWKLTEHYCRSVTNHGR